MAGQSVILEEEIDENFEPSREEVLEYAKWLGMKLPQDEELLWIARDGLKAPLPEHWKPCKTPEGELYYFNFQNGESIWEHPCDEFFKDLFRDERQKLEERRRMRPAQGWAGASAAAQAPELGPPVRRGSQLRGGSAASPLGTAPPLTNPDLTLREPAEGRERQGLQPVVGAPRSLLQGRARNLGMPVDDLPALPSTHGSSVNDSIESLPHESSKSRDSERRDALLDGLEKEYDAWERSMVAEMEEQKATTEKKLRARLEEEIQGIEAGIRAEHEEAVERLAGSNSAQLSELEKAHADVLSEMEQRHGEEIARVRERHREELQRLEEEHESAKAEALRQHGEQLKEAAERRDTLLEEARAAVTDEVLEEARERCRAEAEARAMHEAEEEARAALTEEAVGEIRRRCWAEAEERTKREVEAEVERERGDLQRRLREEMEDVVAEEMQRLRAQKLEEAMHDIEAQVAVEAAARRAEEYEAALDAMRERIREEVESRRDSIEAEVEEEMERSFRTRYELEEGSLQEERLEAKRRALVEEVEAQVAEERRDLLRAKREEMEESVARAIESELAPVREQRRKDIEARMTMQLYEEEAAMLRERRCAVSDKVVKETADFEAALTQRLRQEAAERSKAAAEPGRSPGTNAATSRMQEEVEAHVARERERLLAEATSRVTDEVGAEAARARSRTSSRPRAEPPQRVSRNTSAELSSSDDSGSAPPRETPGRSVASDRKAPGHRHPRRTGGSRRRAADEPPGARDAELLSVAKSFLVQQKRYLKERSELLQHARQEWQRSVEGSPGSPRDSPLMSFVKTTLEEQTRRLNREIKQLSNLKAQVRAMETGRAAVRDITPDVMEMRARAAAAAGSPVLNPFAALSLSEGFAPAAESPRRALPGRVLMDGQPSACEAEMWPPPARHPAPQYASSSSILTKMRGERDAVSSLLSNYSSWLKGLINTVPAAGGALSVPSWSRAAVPLAPFPAEARGVGLYTQTAAMGSPDAPALVPASPDKENGAITLGLDDQRELVISLRPR
uniref:Centrosomal protein CEP164 n=1 Tax=Tetraselmis sp. GSL018 TaxID=582737 RepID=A0A061RCM2_9CHLO|eukprot:CAMPEP_0177583940 /NCGR_PEP_ID=MMETSP0419_2-20121207/3611_1 /TAXON_ID=582737 /ORGANISM="Tetraselmis sp., Strain GSL018" /LENGTH=1027 /DNA_ID=CAMNT_0019073407 /DNA_START=420 /DNA_END=3503 /DNA_ORIENTATION=+